VKPLGIHLQARGMTWLLFVVALVGLSACAPSRPKPADYRAAIDSETVTMLDNSVTTQISRQREWVEEVNGLLKVNVMFRNLTGGEMHLEIKTVFMDESGGEVANSNQTWEPVTIAGHIDYHHSKLCTNTNGRTYHIYVRLAK
jgi:uncharacterized protein YcfL